MIHYELWTWVRGEKDAAKANFQTARLAFQEGRKLIFPEDSPVVEFQVFKIERSCLGGEQANED